MTTRLQLIHRIPISSCQITCLYQFDEHLLVGDEAGELRILNDGSIVLEKSISSEAITCIIERNDQVICAAGHYLITLSKDWEILRRDRVAGDEINEILEIKDGIIVVDDTGSVQLVSDEAMKAEKEDWHTQMATTVDLLGQGYVTGGMDSKVKVWDLMNVVKTFDMVQLRSSDLFVNPPYVNRIQGSRNGKRVIAALGDGSLFCAQLAGSGQRQRWSTELIEAHGASITTITKLDLDLDQIVSASTAGDIKLWSMKSKSVLQTIPFGVKINCFFANATSIFVGDVLGRLSTFRRITGS